MARPLYRDYSSWMLAMEPRLSWVRLTRSQFRKFAMVVMAIFIFSAFLLVGRMEVIKNGYAIVQLRQQRDQLLAEEKQNERRVSDLQSLDHVEGVARQNMNMVDIDPNEVICLKDPTTSGITHRLWRAVFGD